MSKLFRATIGKRFNKRANEFFKWIERPHEAQEQGLKNLITEGRHTLWGKTYNYRNIQNYTDFKHMVPLQDYVSLFPLIEQAMQGKPHVLWPGHIRWFAKSSGTTSGKSKYIPVSTQALEDCHYKAGRDLLAVIFANNPESEIYKGNGLVLGGSHQINKKWEKSSIGDLSAILQQNLPFWTKIWQQPGLRISLLDDWEEKIEAMANEVIRKNITHITGVPTWTVVLINRILEITGKDNLLEVWPQLQLYVHGGVSFKPYREIFKKFIPSEEMYYLETYNASEGFFGFQDITDSEGMALLVNHGIFYEFIPLSQINEDEPEVIPLEQVKTNEQYALVISTNSGLWRYKIGDTIKFISTSPYRFVVTGRTKNFINAFGEEVIIENAESAIFKACKLTSAELNDFTAAPVYFSGSNKGAHEWLIEFKTPPSDKETFNSILDKELQNLNSDYEAKRYKDIALSSPVIHYVEEGTFYRWMKKRGKLGGQNKVPRLYNDRTYLDDLKKYVGIKN